MRKITLDRKEQLKVLENRINYHFNKIYLLDRALTHSSYANQMELSYVEHNERMEFLGDSVLSLVTSEYLFKKYRNKQEGSLTKIRASVVCEDSLYNCAKKINLGDFILLGKGEELSGGRTRASLLADAYEALISAIYIDGGYEKAKEFVLSNLSDALKNAALNLDMKDYKTRLQELVQKKSGVKISYNITGDEGPDHNKTFFAEVVINESRAGKGQGHSKKDAEQEAAKCALESMEAADINI